MSFLERYLNSFSPVGFECELGGQKVWIDEMTKYGNVSIDKYGSAICKIGDGEKRVVLEAHVDEISWLVSHIDKDGFIRVVKNGGSDPSIAPSMRCIIHGSKGKVNGVFGHPAIHINDNNKPSTIDTIFIDLGLESKDAVLEAGVSIGSVVTFADGFSEIGNFYMGRALDNRIGGYIISRVAKRISDSGVKLPFSLYIINAVQEEVGLRGASMVANSIKPDIAFITDVCHETKSPCYNSVKLGEMTAGLGGVVTTGPAVHNTLKRHVIDTLQSKGIKYQEKSSSRSTGTDTDAFAYSNGGVPSVLISTPLRYMHTTVESAHKNDVESIIDSFYESIISLDVDSISYSKYVGVGEYQGD